MTYNEFKYKKEHHDLMQERNQLRKTVLELRNQVKAQSKVIDDNEKLLDDLEEAKKREKEHELEKVRMNAANARDRQDLESVRWFSNDLFLINIDHRVLEKSIGKHRDHRKT